MQIVDMMLAVMILQLMIMSRIHKPQIWIVMGMMIIVIVVSGMIVIQMHNVKQMSTVYPQIV